MQGVCTGLDGVLEDRALRLHDDAHGVWAGLAILQRPEADCGVVQGLPQRTKLLTTKSVKGPERCGPSLHGKLGGGSSAEAGRVTLHRTGARQAEAALGEGEVSWLLREQSGDGLRWRRCSPLPGRSARSGRCTPTRFPWASAPPASGGYRGVLASSPGPPGAMPGAPP
jgi:hypothetical protein